MQLSEAEPPLLPLTVRDYSPRGEMVTNTDEAFSVPRRILVPHMQEGGADQLRDARQAIQVHTDVKCRAEEKAMLLV